MLRLILTTQGFRDQLGRFATWDATLTRNRRREARLVRSKAVAMLKRFAPKETGEFRDSISGRVLDQGKIPHAPLPDIAIIVCTPTLFIDLTNSAPPIRITRCWKSLPFVPGWRTRLRKKIFPPDVNLRTFVRLASMTCGRVGLITKGALGSLVENLI